MKFISYLLRSSSSQNLPYSCALDFEINRRGDHWSPVLQTRNFNRGPEKQKLFDESQVRAKNIQVAQENNMTGSHKKQRYYETVHRTVSPKS